MLGDQEEKKDFVSPQRCCDDARGWVHTLNCFKHYRVQQKKIHKCLMNALIFQPDIQAVRWLA